MHYSVTILHILFVQTFITCCGKNTLVLLLVKEQLCRRSLWILCCRSCKSGLCKLVWMEFPQFLLCPISYQIKAVQTITNHFWRYMLSVVSANCKFIYIHNVQQESLFHQSSHILPYFFYNGINALRQFLSFLWNCWIKTYLNFIDIKERNLFLWRNYPHLKKVVKYGNPAKYGSLLYVLYNVAVTFSISHSGTLHNVNSRIAQYTVFFTKM